MKPPIYNQDILFDVGVSLLISILDYDMINPVSRLIKNKTDTLEDAIVKLRKDLQK